MHSRRMGLQPPSQNVFVLWQRSPDGAACQASTSTWAPWRARDKFAASALAALPSPRGRGYIRHIHVMIHLAAGFQGRPVSLRFIKHLGGVMVLPLMPKATAVWLVENTGLTFEQIAEFCGLHALEVQAIADGEVPAQIHALAPAAPPPLTTQPIRRSQPHPAPP